MRLYSDTHAALPPLAWAANSHFPAFLHYERRKTGRCSFTAALIGGKMDFPAFLRSERRKTGSCRFTPLSSAVKSTFQFSSAQRGGKLAIAALPPLSSAVKSIFQFSSALRGGKLEIAFTLRAHMAEAFQSDFLSSFYSLLLLLGGSWVGA